MSNNQYMTSSDDLVDFGYGYQPLNLKCVPATTWHQMSSTTEHERIQQKSLFHSITTWSLHKNLGKSTKCVHVQSWHLLQSTVLPTTFETNKQYQTFVELDPYRQKRPSRSFASQSPFRRDITVTSIQLRYLLSFLCRSRYGSTAILLSRY